MIFYRLTRPLAFAIVASVLLLLPTTSHSQEPAEKPVRENVKLPGLVVDFKERCVDVESTVCLERGMLELVACTRDTKEHESIVVIAARPMHVHAALLILGAKNGNPAMSRLVDEETNRWIHLPPRGDPIDVSLVIKDADGKTVERPIGDFITHGQQDMDTDGEENEKREFPNTFLFAGSQLRDNGEGPRTYLADQTGSVVSIVTFGDELLALPGIHAKGNEALMWRIDTTHLPKVGSKVTLRLRPSAKADEADSSEESGNDS